MSSGTIDNNRLDKEQLNGDKKKDEGSGSGSEGLSSRRSDQPSATTGAQDQDTTASGTLTVPKVGVGGEEVAVNEPDPLGSTRVVPAKEEGQNGQQHSSNLFAFDPVIEQGYIGSSLNQGMVIDVPGPIQYANSKNSNSSSADQGISQILSQSPGQSLTSSQYIKLSSVKGGGISSAETGDRAGAAVGGAGRHTRNLPGRESKPLGTEVGGSRTTTATTAAGLVVGGDVRVAGGTRRGAGKGE
ncbi:unnamed protein product, partial [Discosporangium mesarthrocarpum]